MAEQIEHTGTITRIDGQNVQVLIEQNSACSACHAKSACSAADSAEKLIDAMATEGNLQVGDRVTVYGAQKMGWKAVMLAFVLPFLLMAGSLFVLARLLNNEAIAGTLALSTLIPYYIVLACFKTRIKKQFVFYVRKN